MRMYSILLFPLFFVTCMAYGQSPLVRVDSVQLQNHYHTLSIDNTTFLSPRNFSRTLNKLFGSVAVGADGGSGLSNNATFDPANGKFAFNGFGQLSAKDSTGLPVFMNLNINAGLQGSSVGELFNNSKLNTNVAVKLKVHIGLGSKSIFFFDEEKQALNNKRDSIFRESLYQLRLASIRVNNIQTEIDRAVAKEKIIYNKISALEITRLRYAQLLAKLNLVNNPDQDSLTLYSDTLAKITSAQDTLLAELNKTGQRLAALRSDAALMVPDATGYSQYVRSMMDQAERNLNNQIDTVELKATINAASFRWVTFNIGFSRQKYYTYDVTKAFDDRIDKQLLDAVDLGIFYNYFHQNFLNGRIIYGNIGISRVKDNNTADLSTTDISQETATSNGTGVTRKVTNKYSAYTDTIVEYNSWKINANLYYLFGNRDKSGVHVFPEFEIRNGLDNVWNGGIGYIFSFKDKKDTKTLINLEAYIKFIDIGNVRRDASFFYNRNSIGVSVGLPFNFIL